MRTYILRLIFLSVCWLPFTLLAQTTREFTAPQKLLKEAQELFRLENYLAAVPLAKEYIKQEPQSNYLYEADYILACAAYELEDANRLEILKRYLAKHPDTPYTNRIKALMASVYFFNENYKKALEVFQLTSLELLSDEELNDMTYRMAISYLATDNPTQAVIWFDTLRRVGSKYQDDCAYYISYIRYTQKRYDEALTGFVQLENNPKYKTLAPYYVADIYLQQKQYDKAKAVAQKHLATMVVDSEKTAEMHRILGEVYYHSKDYPAAVKEFESYTSRINTPQRGALYMMGLSQYQTKVFSKAAAALGEVTKVNDNLTQNANLHLGLSYLQLADKNKARMAFEQAAASDDDINIKEQALYNYALAIHETSFSAFGESVTVFERFLNQFPNSTHTEQISSYLVDVYLNTRSYEAALTSIERISRPNNQIMEAKQKILFQLGTQSFANANFLKAAGYFTRSTEIGRYNQQTNAEAHYWRGEAYYRLNSLPEATRDFTEYLHLNRQPNTEMYALAQYNLGYIAFHRKDYSNARNYLQQFVRAYKSEDKTILADAYNRIADCYLQTRNFSDAKQYYSQAEGLNTSTGDYSFYQLALVAGLEKDYAGKITLLNRLAGKYPASPYAVNALYEKGRSYVLMNNNTQAINAFNELLTKYPESPVTRKAATEIGLLHYQNEQYDQAINAYKYVIQKYPGSEEARLAFHDLKSIYIDLNRVDEFASLAQSLPGNVHFDVNEQDSLTYVAAEKVYARGQINQAKESFNRYIQSYPQGAFTLNAHYYLTVIAKEQKNPELVLLHSAKLLEYPDNPFSEEGLAMRAEVQFNQQSYKEALATYRMLKEKASNADRRVLAETGILRSAFFLRDDTEIIHAATDLLGESKLSPELVTEATYYRAKAYLRQNATQAATTDLKALAKDTRNLFGAEAKYLVAELLYNQKNYDVAEKELLNFIQQSTPHTYWLARGFILLSDVYVAMGRQLDARQYLLSLQQNYQEDDGIKSMIETRLEKL
ncbi:tetratricopeptide repeat protein [Bacteroides sp. 519]|uniref:tetratricopeptide repeat protein n=1 Tax=Bacteroides sp. 519 TaxID=2302937 RepID=UPI0013D1A22C|nr:tetratricopeptide repeat protein [Bacteroides sp. 519]NDV60021.1 outer membrane protein assembly factor BamD [Bacteroides sp. 519]